MIIAPLACTCGRPSHVPECPAACSYFRVYGAIGHEAAKSCTLVGVTGVPFATGQSMPEIGVLVQRYTPRDAIAAVMEAQGLHASVANLRLVGVSERCMEFRYQVGEHGREYRAVLLTSTP